MQAPAPQMTGELRAVAARQAEIARRLKLRRESLDVQVDILDADVRDYVEKRK